VVRGAGRLAGYLCLWEIGHEIHITNLAVHPEWRRQGVARALLDAALGEGRVRGVELAFLEVRPTNAEALSLYESLGFRVIGRRKGYYFDTGEDALLMEADWTTPPGSQPSERSSGTVP
jgi:ribosomal-protein-alanine N-acetyltransferase